LPPCTYGAYDDEKKREKNLGDTRTEQVMNQ
jgi:hypothetical protein